LWLQIKIHDLNNRYLHIINNLIILFVFGFSQANNNINYNPNLNTIIIKDSLKPLKYRLRKYAHVKNFYKAIAKPVTKLCIKENVPPAAVLAMAALESGWNRGYVGRITGNILSLGARKGDKELPALYLPDYIKKGNVVFDSLKILHYNKSKLFWKKRPPSFKKDYRPKNIAGTKYNLAYFNYHPKAKANAQIKNVKDFLNIFISHKSRIYAYRKARQHLDNLVLKYGKGVLLNKKTALYFINAISGKPNTFNYRKTWPKKVTSILNNAGLVDLTKKLYNDHKKFDKIW